METVDRRAVDVDEDGDEITSRGAVELEADAEVDGGKRLAYSVKQIVYW